ncbi:DUF4145 domain-containing protein [Enterococcus faecium]|nr:DUF4145 domain-containing protein [Enterococcus faecium]
MIRQNILIDNKEILFDFPNKCCFCNKANEVPLNIISSQLVPTNNGKIGSKNAFIVTKCPYCENLSFHYYYFDEHQNIFKDSNNYYARRKKYPPTPRSNFEFPWQIEKISPRFIEIFCQSDIAERRSLDELAGMGYRKSLEILLKDYLALKKPDLKESIPKMKVQKAIGFIEIPQLKSLFLAGFKIGNDETHYYKKYEDWDIDNLKDFINSAQTYIFSDYNYLLSQKLIR